MGQQDFRNLPLKPSGPGDLSGGMNLIVSSISFLLKGATKASKPSTGASRSFRLQVITIPLVTPIIFLKADQKALARRSWEEQVVPSASWREAIEFLLCLSDAIAW